MDAVDPVLNRVNRPVAYCSCATTELHYSTIVLLSGLDAIRLPAQTWLCLTRQILTWACQHGSGGAGTLPGPSLIPAIVLIVMNRFNEIFFITAVPVLLLLALAMYFLPRTALSGL